MSLKGCIKKLSAHLDQNDVDVIAGRAIEIADQRKISIEDAGRIASRQYLNELITYRQRLADNERKAGRIGDLPADQGGLQQRLISEPKTSTVQRDLFSPTNTPKNMPKEVAKAEAKNNFSVEYTQRSTGSLAVGIDTVKSPSDAAHILAPLRKHGQETFVVLITNKDGKPIHVIRHTKGGKAQSSVFIDEIIGAIADADSAAGVWFGHNHPSGLAVPSDADFGITGELVNALDGIGVSYNGHIILGYADKAAWIPPGEAGEFTSIKVTPKARSKRVNVTERVIKKRKNPHGRIGSSTDALDYVRGLAGSDYVVFLSTQNDIIGTMHIPAEDMKNMKESGSYKRFMQALSKTNARSILLRTDDEAAAANFERLGDNLGHHTFVLDWIYSGRGGDPISSKARGQSPDESLSPIFKSKDRMQSAVGKTDTTKATVEKAIRKSLKPIEKNTGLRVRVVSYDEIDPDVKSQLSEDEFPKGFIIGDSVYLVHDFIEDARDAQVVFAHEVKGHFGVRRLLGDSWGDTLLSYRDMREDNSKAYQDIKKELDDRYGDLSENEELAEFIAIAAERKEQRSAIANFMNRVIQLMQDGLRAVGFKIGFNVQDINAILSKSEQAMTKAERKASPFEQPSFSKVEYNLPMDWDSRKERAEAMGFDTDEFYYHGTTHDFEAFGPHFLNPESHFGAGYYFSTSAEDVEQHYAGVGPDLKNRIDSLAERIFSNDEENLTEERAKEMAVEQLTEHGGMTMETFLRRGKTYSLTDNENTFLTYEREINDYEDYMDEADGDEDYARQLAEEDSYDNEPVGTLADIIESLRSAADSQYGDQSDAYEFLAEMESIALDGGGIDAQAFDDNYRSSGSGFVYFEGEDGNLISSEIYRQAIEDAGFDSISHQANIFSGMDIDPNAVHTIIFNPNNVRVTNAQFDPRKEDYPNLLFSKNKKSDDLTQAQRDAIEHGFNKHEVSNIPFKQQIDQALEQSKRWFRQGVVDQYRSFKDILHDDRSWMMAHLTTADTNALEQVISAGRIFFDEDVINVDTDQKSMSEVLKPLGSDLDRFLHWVAGNRAYRLKQEGRENLFSDENIEALISLDEGREVLFRNVLKDFEDLNDSIIDIGVKSGLINEEQAELWSEQGFYLPFYRVMNDEEKPKGPRVFSDGKLVRQQAYKHLKGGTSQIGDLMSNMLLNYNHIISASLKNNAAVAAVDAGMKMGVVQEVSKKKKSDNAFYVRRNGEEVWYEAIGDDADLLLDSLLSLNNEGLNTRTVKLMRKAKRVVTTGITLNPEFKLANLIRDTLHSVAVISISPNIAKNLYQGFTNTSNKSKYYASALAGGGVFTESGYIHGADPDAIKYMVDKGVDRNTILTNINLIKKMYDTYQDFGNRLENVNRMAAYIQNIEKGRSKLEATHEARSVLDFSRTGSFPAIRFIAQTVPFFNARLQGLDRMTEALKDPAQKKQFMTMVSLYTMASVMLHLYMKDDEDYQEEEEWVRDTYHLFKLPGSDTMYRIPRPFEIGAIASLGERTVEQFTNDKVHGDLFTERLLHTLTETFSFNPTPQLIKPIAEVGMNKNWFTKRDIESMSMERLSPKNRKREWTSETSIAASQFMDKILWDEVVLSPVQIEHLVRGYFGWAGAQAMAGADMAIRAAQGAPDRPEKKWNEYPVLKRFVAANPTRNTKYTSEFYETLKEIQVTVADLNHYKETKQTEKYAELYKESGQTRRLKNLYDKENRKLQSINRRLKKIYRSKTMSPEEKRRQTDLLTVKKNRITKMVSDKVRAKD